MLGMLIIISSVGGMVAPVNASTGGCGTVNIALGKTVTALTSTVSGYPASNIVDGNVDSPWWSLQSSNSQYIAESIVDLGSVYSIGKIELGVGQVWGYTVSTSTDSITYIQQHQNEWTDQNTSISATVSHAVNGSYSARYIKFYGYANWNQYVGLSEMRVYEWLSPPPSPPSGNYGTINIALNKSVTVIEPDSLTPQSIIDGNPASTWTSSGASHDDANPTKQYGYGTIMIDLGQIYAIGKINVKPDKVHGYNVILSETNVDGPPLHWQSGSPWVFQSYANLFGTAVTSNELHTFNIDGAISARYIWLSAHVSSSPAQIQASIAEVEVFEWQGQGPVPETDWLTGWTYRKAMTISGSTSLLTDYQVKVPVNFVNGKMNSNFSDIHFTSTDGNTPLACWMESSTASTSATFWVKVPSIPTGGTNIYMYYGNSSATSASNGENTFELFDDFPGTTLDAGKWLIDQQNSGATYSISDGKITLASGSEGAIHLRSLFLGGDNTKAFFKGVTTSGGDTGKPYALVGYASRGSPSVPYGMYWETHPVWYNGGSYFYAKNESGAGGESFPSDIWAGPHDWAMAQLGDRVQGFMDNALKSTLTDYLYHGNRPVDFVVAQYNNASTNLTIDAIWVTKYVSSELAATVGTEEATQFTLTMAINGSGNITPAIGTHAYPAGTVVPVTSTPAQGHQFLRWTGDVSAMESATTASTTITMNGNYSIIANFALSSLPFTYQITDNNASELNLDVATDSSGMPHIVYERNGNIYYKNGLGIEEPIGAGTLPAIAIGGNDVPQVIFVNNGSIYFAKKSATSWSVPASISGGSYADIDIDTNGNAHIVYQAHVDYDYNGQSYLEIMYTNNIGGDFVTPTMIWDSWFWYENGGKDGRYYDSPCIKVDSLGFVHFIAREHVRQGATGWDYHAYDVIYASTSGGSWVSGDKGAGLALFRNSLTVDANNQAHIVYSNGTLYYSIAGIGESTLGAGTQPAIDAHGVDIGIAYNDGTNNIKLVTGNGSGLNTPIDVDAGVAPAVALGSIYVYYIKSDGVDDEVFLKTDRNLQQVTLTIAKTGNGTVTPTVGDHVFQFNEVVNLTANPEADYHFVNWIGAVENPNATSTTVTMNTNKTVTANFAANLEPVASFTASPNPVAPGQNITFDATDSNHPDTNRHIVSYSWAFGDGQSGNGSVVTHAYATFGSYTATLTVTDDNTPPKTGTATLVINVNAGNQAPVANAGGPYTAVPGNATIFNGSGSSDPNVSAGDYIASFQWNVKNGVYTLSGQSPALSWVQISALGAGVHPVSLIVTDSFGLTGTATTTLTVTFPAYTLTVAVNPAGSGTVVKDPNQASYVSGTQVQLTPIPANAGWVFSHWSVDASGNANPLSVTMDDNKNITANFIQSDITMIQTVKDNPTQFVGQTVKLSGTYRGWETGHGSPPVTRSDFVVLDETGAIYVTGTSALRYPDDLGKPVQVIGIVRIKNGQPYIEVQRSR